MVKTTWVSRGLTVELAIQASNIKVQSKPSKAVMI